MGLDTVEIVLWAEKEFGIAITDADAGEVSTVGDFSQLIYNLLLIKNGLKNTTNEEIIYNKIKALLVKQYLVKESQINRNATFIADLRLDWLNNLHKLQI